MSFRTAGANGTGTRRARENNYNKDKPLGNASLDQEMFQSYEEDFFQLESEVRRLLALAARSPEIGKNFFKLR